MRINLNHIRARDARTSFRCGGSTAYKREDAVMAHKDKNSSSPTTRKDTPPPSTFLSLSETLAQTCVISFFFVSINVWRNVAREFSALTVVVSISAWHFPQVQIDRRKRWKRYYFLSQVIPCNLSGYIAGSWYNLLLIGSCRPRSSNGSLKY